MIVRGRLNGCPYAVRLTWREGQIFCNAQRSGVLTIGTRIAMLDFAWRADREVKKRPHLVVYVGRRTASVVLDLGRTRHQLDETGVQAVKIVLLRAGGKAANPAARGRLRRTLVTPRLVYARVPLRIAEPVAEALRQIVRAHTEPTRRRSRAA